MRLPVTLLEGIESVLQQLTSVVTRAAVVLEAIEGMPQRVSAVLDEAERVPARIDAVLAKTDRLTKKVDQISKQVDSVVAEATRTLAALQPAVAAVAELEPGLITSLVEEAAQGVPLLLTAVEERLLPALASLEQLVPVVEHLGMQVDHLDATVADVGAMLGGIPGAARLLKRGATTAAGRG